MYILIGRWIARLLVWGFMWPLMALAASLASDESARSKVLADSLAKKLSTPPCNSVNGPVSTAKCFKSPQARHWLNHNNGAIDEIVALYKAALSTDTKKLVLVFEVSNAMQRVGRYCMAAEVLRAARAELGETGYTVSAPLSIEAARTAVGCALLSDGIERGVALAGARNLCAEELQVAKDGAYLRSAGFSSSYRAKLFSVWTLAFDYENENPKTISDTAMLIAGRPDLLDSWDEMLAVYIAYRDSIPNYVRVPTDPALFARSIAIALLDMRQHP